MVIKVHITWQKNQFNIWSIIGSLKFWMQTTVVEMQIFFLYFCSGWNSWQWPGVVCVHWICEQPADCVLWLPARAASLQHWSAGIPSLSGPRAVPAAWRISATCRGKPALTALPGHAITCFCESVQRWEQTCQAIFHVGFGLHRIQGWVFSTRWLTLDREGKVQEHLCLQNFYLILAAVKQNDGLVVFVNGGNILRTDYLMKRSI